MLSAFNAILYLSQSTEEPLLRCVDIGSRKQTSAASPVNLNLALTFDDETMDSFHRGKAFIRSAVYVEVKATISEGFFEIQEAIRR
ncbi:SubName: Full=Uncharacterized protein {ECO:0000313/EMBL:CCA75823.1} [Serendipita indica DSM 11827]|nr:SubName: Full=Uncharacterized protein {ECO:0000313/EMBL:CCA75823.1} [Serendipita indica DSM 11827]